MSLTSQFGISNRYGHGKDPWPSPNRVWRWFPAFSTASGQFGTWKANVSEIYIETQYPKLTISWLPNTTIWSFTGVTPFFFGLISSDYISDSVFVICSGEGKGFSSHLAEFWRFCIEWHQSVCWTPAIKTCLMSLKASSPKANTRPTSPLITLKSKFTGSRRTDCQRGVKTKGQGGLWEIFDW
jgi:hypothetical protein